MTEPAQERSARLRRVRRWLGFAVIGIALYIVAPTLAGVYGALGAVADLDPRWLVVIIACEVAHLVCTWDLLRVALRTRSWLLVATSQLASNAVGIVLPAGAAAGAATQHQMLRGGGIDPTRSASSLTAVSLLTTGSVFALPVLALPVVLAGAPVPGQLQYAMWLGALAFVVLAVGGTVLLLADAPLEAVGRLIERVGNRFRPEGSGLEGLPVRLVDERDLIRRSLGEHWWRVILLTIGRMAFDYLTLLAALAAVGAHPHPSLVLIAFAVTEVLALLPITPGGLGVVEASLAATLAIAGVDAGSALVATAAYRLVTFWLPLPAGVVAAVIHRRRFGRFR